MKSRKIQRLELVLDKIEGGDSKRKVMLIRFGHPTKKNSISYSSPWEAAMARLEFHGRRPWGLTGEGGGRGWGEGAWGGAATRGGVTPTFVNNKILSN
jgi:hypothetical protein